MMTVIIGDSGVEMTFWQIRGDNNIDRYVQNCTSKIGEKKLIFEIYRMCEFCVYGNELYDQNNNSNNENVIILKVWGRLAVKDGPRADGDDGRGGLLNEEARETRSDAHRHTHAGARAHARCSHTDLYKHTRTHPHTQSREVRVREQR